MKVRDLVKITNRYLAGEQLTYQRLVPFFDATIDDINNRLSSTYPTFSSLGIIQVESENAVYNYFPDQYLRSVVALGAAHKFYVADEEGNTFDPTFEMDYERSLFYMTRDFVERVPLQYQADTTGSVIVNINQTGLYPWFNGDITEVLDGEDFNV